MVHSRGRSASPFDAMIRPFPATTLCFASTSTGTLMTRRSAIQRSRGLGILHVPLSPTRGLVGVCRPSLRFLLKVTDLDSYRSISDGLTKYGNHVNKCMEVKDSSAEEAVQFRWKYYEGGYEWQKVADAKARYLSSPAPSKPIADSDRVLTNDRPTGSYEVISYKPPTDLFLAFSKTEPTKEGIKGFADKYGLLGFEEGEGRVFITIPATRAKSGSIWVGSRGDPPTGFVGSGELLSAWRSAIRDMRIAVEIWSMVREAEKGSDQALRRYISWQGPDRVLYETPAEERKDYAKFAVIASPQIRPEFLKRFTRGSVFGPAQYYLQSLINDSLEGLVSPRLLWTWSRRGGADARAVPRTLGLFFVPRSLLGYLWLQLAEAVARKKTFRRCKVCDMWILIAAEGDGSRASRLTCSNTCRMRLYQERMKEAARLFAKGRTVDQIARQLGAESNRVRRWVSANAATKRS
jgi:hypothetical protein